MRVAYVDLKYRNRLVPQ